jgi:hypothetical protein
MEDRTVPRHTLKPSGIVTLTTDFGEYDWYVGAMKGVILRRFPGAKVVDISHEVPPQNVAHAAFLLAHTIGYFPEGTVHIAVVDPGVGSARRGIAIQTEHQFLVGPDNGILSLCADADGMIEARELTNEDVWHEPVSRTFHGRDIFSPVGASIASGAGLAKLGAKIGEIQRLGLSAMVFTVEGRVSGRVVYIDSFGNLVTNIRREDLAEVEPLEDAEVEIEDTVIDGVVEFYRASVSGSLIALFGSIGFLEISVVEGNAAAELDVGVGAQVVVRSGGE